MLPFQFHKGTIRTHSPQCCGTGYRHFNSIKVQLELRRACVGICNQSFQFHKGTIRTPGGQQQLLYAQKFQFHKGTIRTAHILHASGSESISIP